MGRAVAWVRADLSRVTGAQWGAVAWARADHGLGPIMGRDAARGATRYSGKRRISHGQALDVVCLGYGSFVEGWRVGRGRRPPIHACFEKFLNETRDL